MKKPLKVLSSTALAAVFTATSLVPVAAASETAESVTFDLVVLEKDGNYYEIDKSEYYAEKLLGTEFAPFKIVKSSEGKYYKKDDFYSYKLITSTITEAFQELDVDKKALDLGKTGKVVIDEKTGEVSYVLDEQPEDRLNETFFYNVA